MDKYLCVIGEEFMYAGVVGKIKALRELDNKMVVAEFETGDVFNVEVLTKVSESGNMSLERFLEEVKEKQLQEEKEEKE